MFSGVDMVFTIPIFSSASISIGKSSGVSLSLRIIVRGKLIANPRLVLYVVLGLHIVLDIGMDVRIDGDGIDADIPYVLSGHIFITIWTS